jgi:TolB-like protein
MRPHVRDGGDMRALTLLAVGLTAFAARAETRRVAVLELQNPAGVQAQEVRYLADVVRTAGLRLDRARWLVLTRENLLQLLPPGRDLAGCVGECEVETGRNVGADHVVAGEIVRFDGSLRVSLRLYDTASGALVAAERAQGDSLAALEPHLEEAAGRLYGHLSAKPAPAPVAAAATAEPQVVAVSVFVRTGIAEGAGTDANVCFWIGRFVRTCLDLARRDDFEAGDGRWYGPFALQAPVPRSAFRELKLHLWHDGTGRNPDWQLAEAAVRGLDARGRTLVERVAPGLPTWLSRKRALEF